MLSTPPAFVLSQDQTLHDIWKSVWLLFIDWYYSLFDVLYNRTSHVGVHSVHCSVFKGHRCHHRVATTFFILTNSEELVKDEFELFSNSNHPGLHKTDLCRIKFLQHQGLAPTAHLVYYGVKNMSRIFFKSLTPAAGRCSQFAKPCHIDQLCISPFIRSGPP